MEQIPLDIIIKTLNEKKKNKCLNHSKERKAEKRKMRYKENLFHFKMHVVSIALLLPLARRLEINLKGMY